MERLMKRSKFLKCFITNITTTRNEIEIWCQTDTKVSSRVETSLDLVHNHLSDLFAINSQNLRPIPTPEVGQNYLTHMKNDLHFHRVLVTHTDEDLSRASVLFIDFGVEDWVPFNQLVEWEELFQVDPLAQKFFLADIQTKGKGWDSEEVKRCLQPFVLSVFQCEVIGVNKNTECIRVYDQFFNQPLVQSLVKHCNAFLTYPSYGKEIFEAIDLTINRINGNTKIEISSPKTNGLSNNLKNELKSSTIESFPEDDDSEDDVLKDELFKDDVIANKENVCPSIPSETNGNSGKFDYEEQEVEQNPSQQEVTTTEEVLEESSTLELNKSIPKVNGEDLNGMLVNGDLHNDSTEETVKTQELEVNENEMNSSLGEPVVSQECDLKNDIEVESQPIVEEVNENKCNDKDVCVSLQNDVTSGDCLDSGSPKKAIPEELDQKGDTVEESIDLCPNRELIGQTQSIYLTTNLSNSFYCQLSSQFDVIQGLTEKMTAFYNQFYGLDKYGLNLSSVKVNDIIAARFSGDLLWYRALVKANSGTHLDLIYLDFGNIETVDIKECKELVEEFLTTDMKAQAFLCQVVGEQLSPQTIDKYIDDMVPIECQFQDFQTDRFLIKIISLK